MHKYEGAKTFDGLFEFVNTYVSFDALKRLILSISTSAAYFEAKAKAKEEKRIAKEASKAAKAAEKAKVR